MKSEPETIEILQAQLGWYRNQLEEARTVLTGIGSGCCCTAASTGTLHPPRESEAAPHASSRRPPKAAECIHRGWSSRIACRNFGGTRTDRCGATLGITLRQPHPRWRLAERFRSRVIPRSPAGGRFGGGSVYLPLIVPTITITAATPTAVAMQTSPGSPPAMTSLV
jgi:hypothetical protein